MCGKGQSLKIFYYSKSKHRRPRPACLLNTDVQDGAGSLEHLPVVLCAEFTPSPPPRVCQACQTKSLVTFGFLCYVLMAAKNTGSFSSAIFDALISTSCWRCLSCHCLPLVTLPPQPGVLTWPAPLSFPWQIPSSYKNPNLTPTPP